MVRIPKNAISSFWLFQISGWLLFALVSIPVKWALFGSLLGAAISLYRELLGFLLTCGMRLIYRRFYKGRNASRILSVILLLSFVASALEILISYAVHDLVFFEEVGFGSDANRLIALYYRAAVFASWSCLYFVFRLYYEAKDLDVRLARAVAENRDAEAQLLRSQMSPHFLFNALTTIRGSVERSQDELKRIIQSLADYLVYSLDHGRDRLVTLGVEFDATCNYLEVEKSRFLEGIEIDCHIDETARSIRVPGIILQPLVETVAGELSTREDSDPHAARRKRGDQNRLLRANKLAEKSLSDYCVSRLSGVNLAGQHTPSRHVAGF